VKPTQIVRCLKIVGGVVAAVAALYLATTATLRYYANRDLAPVLSSDPIRPKPDATNLIVVVHAYKQGVANMADVSKAIDEARPDADILLVKYPASLFSNADCNEIAERLCQTIHEVWKTGKYNGVELVGYSMGALLARKAYVYGMGRTEDLDSDPNAPYFVRDSLDWAKNTNRLVLLAGMNRGWTTRSRPDGMGRLRMWQFKLGKAVGVLTGTAKLIRQCEAGQPFVANLRMQWLEAQKTRSPVVVQLLGDEDDIVTREDERDIAVSKGFVWVQLSGTGHENAADFRGNKGEPLSIYYAKQRERKFKQALGNEEALELLRRASPRLPSEEDKDVVTGVVVLHGSGIWVAVGLPSSRMLCRSVIWLAIRPRPACRLQAHLRIFRHALVLTTNRAESEGSLVYG